MNDAARTATLKAKQADEEAGRKISQKVAQVLPPTLLTATNKLRSDLIPLIRCLDTARGHARANLLGQIDQLQKDPGAFSQWIIKDLMDRMQTTFPQAIAPSLQMLRNGMNPPPQAGQLIDMAIDTLERLAATHEGARCLLPLLNQHRPALKNSANQIQGTLKTQTKIIFDTHIAPALHEAIGKGLTRILTGKDSGVLLSEEELESGLESGVREISDSAIAEGHNSHPILHQSVRESRSSSLSPDAGSTRPSPASSMA